MTPPGGSPVILRSGDGDASTRPHRPRDAGAGPPLRPQPIEVPGFRNTAEQEGDVDVARRAHRTVDDRPYGGGPGMVMKVEPLRAAIRATNPSISRPSFMMRCACSSACTGVKW